MQFHPSDTSNSIISDIDFLLFGTGDTLNTDYSLADRTRNVNIAWDEAVSELYKADPNFEWDDIVSVRDKWWSRAAINGGAERMKKGPPPGVLFSSVIVRLIKFSKGFADGTFLEDLFVVHHPDQKRGGAQAVICPW